MNTELRAILDRLLDQMKARRVPEPTYNCRCRDAGWLLQTQGRFSTPRGLPIEATPDSPVATRCERCNPVKEMAESSYKKRYG